MSKETHEWLSTNTLIGFTAKRGFAWHYRAGDANHWEAEVPVKEVEELLKRVNPVSEPRPCKCGCGDDQQEIIDGVTGHRYGTFKKGYRIHDYSEWLLNNVSTILDGDLFIGSAGLLKKGAQAWVSVEAPDTITTPEGVEFRPFILAATSLDGSIATGYSRVVTNTVCDNTLAIARAEKDQKIKYRHTANSTGTLKIASAREALAIMFTASDDFAAEVKELCETTVTDAQWAAFLDAHTPLTAKNGEPLKGRGLTIANNERDQLSLMWKTDARCAPWTGTAFGVLQTVNTFNHHFATVKNVSRPERNMANMVDGTTAKADIATLAKLDMILSA